MLEKADLPKLRLLPYSNYVGINRDDPLRYYYWPVIGKMYRRRIELCLGECKGGDRGLVLVLHFLTLMKCIKQFMGWI